MRQQTGPPQLPIYPFRCDACGAEFEVTRPVAAEYDPLSCPACGNDAQRMTQAIERAGGQSAWYHAGHSHDDWSGGHAHAEGEAEWADVYAELQQRIAQWMEQLQAAGVVGAGQFSSLIGPSIEIYGAYASVLDIEGRRVPLGGNAEADTPFERGYLAYVWETLGRVALQRVLGTNIEAIDSDARLTVLFLLWTMPTNVSEDPADLDASPVEEFGLPFDVVRCFAQPLGIDLDAMTNRIITVENDTVRLIPVADRASQLLGEERAPRDTTPLDRLHTAMLLEADGRTGPMRDFARAEQEGGPGFLRLARALGTLYRPGSEERRLLDAVRLAVIS